MGAAKLSSCFLVSGKCCLRVGEAEKRKEILLMVIERAVENERGIDRTWKSSWWVWKTPNKELFAPTINWRQFSFFTQNYVNGFSGTKAKIKRFFFNRLERYATIFSATGQVLAYRLISRIWIASAYYTHNRSCRFPGVVLHRTSITNVLESI
jgi:hypothetical protein